MKSVSAAASDLTTTVPTRWRWLHRCATLLLILVALFWVATAALAALLRWYVIPNIDSLRPRLEAYASEQLQRPVRIDRIVAEQSGGVLNWFPHFEIQGLRILSADSMRNAAAPFELALGRVQVRVSPVSLLQLKIDQLSIEAPLVQVRRNSAGTWSVAGVELVPSQKPSPALDWLFSQREILITKGAIDFQDDFLKQPSVRVSNVQLLLRNSLRSHQVRLDATPPAVWGQSLQWQGVFRHPLLAPHVGDWQSWTGTAYAAVVAPTPKGFAVYLPERIGTYADLFSGTQSLAAWGQLSQGKLSSLDIAAVNIPKLAASAKVHIEGWDASPTPKLKVTSEAKLTHTDAAGFVKAQWQQTAHPLGQLDLKANLARFDLSALSRYLNLVPALQGGPAVQYLQSALERGVATDVDIKLSGALKDFPFLEAKTGEFKVTGLASDVQFNLAPHTTWPSLRQTRAHFDLSGMTLSLSNIEALWADLPMKGDVLIANLQQPVITLSAETKAPIGHWLKLVNTTPIHSKAGSLLEGASGTGLLSARITMSLPANAPAQTKVAGTLTLQNNKLETASLRLNPSAPVLSELKGSVSFTESSYALEAISGKALGGDFKLASVAAGAAASGTVIASGTADIAAIQNWQTLGTALPALAPILTNLHGQLPYSLRFSPSVGAGYSLLLESSLIGLQSKLPEPLAKAAALAWPLRLEHTVSASAPIQRTRLQLGDVIAVQLQQDMAGSAFRGSVRVGPEAVNTEALGTYALPERGIDALLRLTALDVDPWLKLATDFAKPANNTSTSANLGVPTRISAAVDQLTLANRRFDQVVLGATQQNGIWRMNAKSNDLDGYFEYKPDQLIAKLAHLRIPDSQSKAQLENLLQDSPRSLPALDIVVDEFELANKRLGRLEIQAINQRAASNLSARTALEWRLQKLWLIQPDATFKGSGVWDNKRVDLQFVLDVADSGALLARLGLPGTIQGGKGSIQGRVGWLGSPLALHYPSMAGQLRLDFAKGQFLKVDPGAGRLLGVLSLQALPRLFKLDFRDIFSDGFAFDSFGGDAQIKDGVASTQNLQMKSVLALVSINGQADLAKETQDLRVLVLPDVNAGGASLLATLINPVVGAASYLAQLILRRPIVAAATKDYHIQGTWQNPKVSQVPAP